MKIHPKRFISLSLISFSSTMFHSFFIPILFHSLSLTWYLLIYPHFVLSVLDFYYYNNVFFDSFLFLLFFYIMMTTREKKKSNLFQNLVTSEKWRVTRRAVETNTQFFWYETKLLLENQDERIKKWILLIFKRKWKFKTRKWTLTFF